MPALRVLLVALVLAGCGTGSPPAPARPSAASPATARVEIDYVGGAVAGGVVRRTVPRGATVTLVVRSDVADEVHVHGYDRRAWVAAGGAAELTFPADLPGVFEVELESRGAPLAELLVS
jgi:hypothetical protein